MESMCGSNLPSKTHDKNLRLQAEMLCKTHTQTHKQEIPSQTVDPRHFLYVASATVRTRGLSFFRSLVLFLLYRCLLYFLFML